MHRANVDSNMLVNLDGTVVNNSIVDGRVESVDGRTSVDYTLMRENRAATLTMDIGGTDTARIQEIVDAGGTTGPVEIDPAELGITLGYAEPFLVSDDGNRVYLRQVFEGEGCDINGLWRYNVMTGDLETIDILKELDIHGMNDYSINPKTEQLIGVGYKLIDDPEAVGPSCGKPDGVRTLYLIDLKTGASQVLLQDEDDVYYRPMLSDGGSGYAFQLTGSESVWMGTVDSSQAPQEAVLGYLYDWFGNTLVVDYGNELILYDRLNGNKQVLGQDEGPDAQIDYVGTIIVK